MSDRDKTNEKSGQNILETGRKEGTGRKWEEGQDGQARMEW